MVDPTEIWETVILTFRLVTGAEQSRAQLGTGNGRKSQSVRL